MSKNVSHEFIWKDGTKVLTWFTDDETEADCLERHARARGARFVKRFQDSVISKYRVAAHFSATA